MRIPFAAACAALVTVGAVTSHAQRCAIRAAQRRQASMVAQMQRQQQMLNAQRQQQQQLAAQRQQAELQRRQQQQAVLQGMQRQQQMANLRGQQQMLLELQRQREQQMLVIRQRAAELTRRQLLERMLRGQELLRQTERLKSTLLQQALMRDLVRMRDEMSKQGESRWGEKFKKELSAKQPPKKPVPAVSSLSAKRDTETTRLASLPTKVESDEVLSLGTSLIGAPAIRQEHVLKKLHEGKGASYTKALALAIPLLEDEMRDKARKTLAGRLTRMSSATLKKYFRNDNAEVRRAALVASAMKDERTLIPAMIECLDDDEPSVVEAGHSALKAMTRKDFGSSTRDWKAWLASSK